ncbi:TetR/AcrR family transcriptional regulator [Microbacterium indicum]|uniref:TetR/AcrR family transcriptional regulator n=1 Tax=Microbacterium indicum TaxID=358100 RepID=UPI0003F99549|nr:TetR/AcrR family transcriptional regulator [Microbacterium indicum]
MATNRGRGRPKAISREMLAEAAGELFLERGYDETSITEIATRAGVGRSSFFNYAAGKADLLWGGLDERIRAAAELVDVGASASEAVVAIADGFAPDALALAFANAGTMRIEAHLEAESALRMLRVSRLTARALVRDGADPLAAEVRGGAFGAALVAALRAWALGGAGATPLAAHMRRAVAAAEAR